MTTPTSAIAQCILDWIYQQVHEVLQKLKQFLLQIISYIDALIATLRAWLAQCDLLAKAEEFVWNQIQKIIEEVRNALTGVPDGPGAEECPEFYQSFMEPARAIFENLVATLTIFRERFHDDLSYMDEIDQLISYWDQTKADLVALVEILDDAILMALSEAGESVP